MNKGPWRKRFEYYVREENTALASIFGPIVRLEKALSVTLPDLIRSIAWAMKSKEFTNYSYELSDKNLRDLSEILAVTTGRRSEAMEQFIDEILQDRSYGDRLDEICRSTRWRRVIDLPIHLGRRAGWYALVRHFKPKCVVEIGLEHGFGAAALARALERNEADGHPGKYLGIDRWEHGGWLLPPEQSSRARLIRDEAAALPGYLDRKIDFLVYDAWPGFEAEFYELIAPHLARDAVILTDDGNDNEDLRNFARLRGQEFIFFQEQPQNHWFRTGGIGISYPPQQQPIIRQAQARRPRSTEFEVVSD